MQLDSGVLAFPNARHARFYLISFPRMAPCFSFPQFSEWSRKAGDICTKTERPPVSHLVPCGQPLRASKAWSSVDADRGICTRLGKGRKRKKRARIARGSNGVSHTGHVTCPVIDRRVDWRYTTYVSTKRREAVPEIHPFGSSGSLWPSRLTEHPPVRGRAVVLRGVACNG
jgi:hypothetical protein